MRLQAEPERNAPRLLATKLLVVVIAMPKASDWDHRIIDATSIALDGKIGRDDDVDRLREKIEQGEGEDKLKTACEIAVAFIRWAQDLKQDKGRDGAC